MTPDALGSLCYTARAALALADQESKPGGTGA
jgi:hypothetical protein